MLLYFRQRANSSIATAGGVLYTRSLCCRLRRNERSESAPRVAVVEVDLVHCSRLWRIGEVLRLVITVCCVFLVCLLSNGVLIAS